MWNNPPKNRNSAPRMVQQPKESFPMNFRQITTLIGGVFAAIFALTVVLGSWYTIDERERGVLLRNGKLVGVVQPGLGFKVPFIDNVVSVSTETILLRLDKEAVYSRDQQPAEITISVNWRVAESNVDEVYTQFASLRGVQDRVIIPRVRDELKNVMGRYNAVTAIQDRTRLGADVKAAIVANTKGPFLIENVQIETVDFSDAYEKSIEERMRAEVEVARLQQNLEREKVQAQIVVTQAQAQADSVRARAEAEAAAIQMRGEAEAKAIRARGDALRANADLVALTAAEKWNGQLPATMVPGAALPFVQVK
jgi:regulator of protease activity HflC (stomatin/prohibitin superfamily)